MPTTTTTTLPPPRDHLPPTTTTTAPGLDPADAAAWVAFAPILPEEAIPPFLGGGM